ncbi:ATP-binding protein [Streptacidiphilus sp. PB12-B1b]|nr:ATP-binding protein [Streptacidiphilus sp. PB12-B1b]
MSDPESYPPPPSGSSAAARPAPPSAAIPPMPSARPHAGAPPRPGFDLVGWLSAPRHTGAPGVYGLGPAPRTRHEQQDADPGVPGWKLLLRALLNLVVAWEVFYYLGSIVSAELHSLLMPYVGDGFGLTLTTWLVDLGEIALLVKLFGGMGRWPLVWRRYGLPPARAVARRLAGATEGRVAIPVQGAAQPQPVDPWREFRALAHPEDLRLVDQQTAQGLVADVDHQRLNRALECVRHDPERLTALLDAVRDHGAAACAHPSGARDLAGRGAQHDLLLRQVLLGTAEDVPKNPAEYRGTQLALDPVLLGTSLLAVGPAGTGKTARLARPVAEALCLQALAGTAAVVVVGSDSADLGPDSWYDVVIAPGSAHSRYGLDLYGGARSADAAAAQLADALLPDELARRADSARQALQQIVGPFRAAFGRAPGVRELSLLLRGEPVAWEGLQDALHAAEQLEEYRHELAQRERTRGQADDPGVLLADRLALLDRPAFAGCFNPSRSGRAAVSGPQPDEKPLFAMHALDHPLRVRVKLPEHSHPEAARIMARLAVGQFLHAAGIRQDRSLFAGLVVDDASTVIDAHTVRGLQRLRGAHAGAVLLLRTLVDLPEALRAPLFGAVGGRMAFPGIAPWDGTLFAETWGDVWVDERDVTRAPDTSGGFLKRTWRGARAVLEGERAHTESVTTRRVERRRWSPSELAQVLPGGHAVLSLTAVDGTPVPPLLVDLRG